MRKSDRNLFKFVRENAIILPAVEQSRLAILAQLGCARSCDLVVRSMLRMCLKMARQAASTNHADDLFSEAVAGVLVAIQKFDRERQVRFSTYANWRIRAAIAKYLRKRSTFSWAPRNANAPSSLDSEIAEGMDGVDFVVDHREFTPAEYYARSQRDKRLWKRVMLLNERQRFVLLSLAEGLPERSVAVEMDISHRRVQQIYDQAIKRLQKMYRTKQLGNRSKRRESNRKRKRQLLAVA